MAITDYAPGSGFTGTLLNGEPHSVGPNAAKVAGGGNGFLTTNIPGYSTDDPASS